MLRSGGWAVGRLRRLQPLVPWGLCGGDPGECLRPGVLLVWD